MRSLRARIEFLEGSTDMDFTKLTEEELDAELLRVSVDLTERGVVFSTVELEEIQQLLQRVDPGDRARSAIEQHLQQQEKSR
jgi:hypothetical protein